MLSAKLLVVGGDVKTTEIQLRLPAIIGRGKGSTITLLQPLVSRQHCELFEAKGKLWVRDLGSLNGTYVNNEKVSEGEIPPNELLTVGTVTFRAIYDPLADEESPTMPVPQYLPNKARQDDDQATIRVDAPGSADVVVAYGAVEEIARQGDDEAGVPSTPLFAAEPTKPAATSQRRTVAAPRPAPPARPSGPVAIPSVVTTDAIKPAPATATPVPGAQTEPAEEDDDLNDFLKSLGKK